MTLRTLAATTTMALAIVGAHSASADTISDSWKSSTAPDITIIVAAGDHITADPGHITRNGTTMPAPAAAVCHTGATPLCHIA
ncbi:hypothetical protein [Streptomyces sp. NBC_01264]|uniref:hypothetical protein n=1 Tax=Streptomyces sp. NBC_01264 TaxID=2903804 RepID=UPI0022512C92|nr:hypothetical protein [Streptomyces sp. NBC_01264]MCX4784534.1 hypothetical protein [Streptomyces sp. NBC_01264]